MEEVESTALELFEDKATSLAPREPDQTITEATAIANSVAAIVNNQELYTTIGSKKHVHVEGWTSMLAIMGIVPQEIAERTHAREDGSYEATVELVRMNDGRVVGRATSECGRGEPDWMGRPDFQRRSMAVTRAVGKAGRLSFSWIMVLAGYSATPAEEMINVKTNQHQATATTPPPVTANPSGVAEVPFGKNKGTPITELSDNSLAWYTNKARSNLADPDYKEAWVPKERTWLDVLIAEGLRREQGQGSDGNTPV